MCFGMWIAAGSVFLARQQLFPAFLRNTGALYFLTALPLLVMVFWVVRIRFTSAYKPRLMPGSSPGYAPRNAASMLKSSKTQPSSVA
jgi:hypothetical protein